MCGTPMGRAVSCMDSCGLPQVVLEFSLLYLCEVYCPFRYRQRHLEEKGFHALSIQCMKICRRREPPVGNMPFVFLYCNMCIAITKSIHKIYVTIFYVGKHR